MKLKKENDLKTNCEAESSKKIMRKRVKGKKRVKKKTKKNKGVFMLRGVMLRVFLYKLAYICTLVQRGMF